MIYITFVKKISINIMETKVKDQNCNIGEFDQLVTAFSSYYDEKEIIELLSCINAIKEEFNKDESYKHYDLLNLEQCILSASQSKISFLNKDNSQLIYALKRFYTREQLKVLSSYANRIEEIYGRKKTSEPMCILELDRCILLAMARDTDKVLSDYTPIN